MPKPKGGRGHTAPYQTKLARIPLPLVEQISELVERYQEYIAAGGEALSPPPLLEANAWRDELLEESHREKGEILQQLIQVAKERDELDQELNALHEKNGDLNLEVEILKQQLVDAANPVNEFQLKEAIATAEYWEATAKDAEKKLLRVEQKLAESLKPVNKLTPSKAPKAKRLSSANAAALISVRENALHAASVDPKLSVAASDLVDSIDKAISKPVNNLNKPVNNLGKSVNNLQPLKATQLGKRLGYKDHSFVGRHKLKAYFTDWSRGKDPDGIGWRYDVESKLFYPVQ